MSVVTDTDLTGVGSGDIQSATVTLTAAQLADLHDTPVELVPAPGEGKMLWLDRAIGSVREVGSHALNGIAVWWDSYLDLAADSSFADFSALAFHCSVIGQETGNGMGNGVNDDVVNAALLLVQNSGTPIPVQGAILTSAINTAGTGYIALETVTIGDATIRIDTVGGSGEVLTYTVTVPGTNNIIGAAQATTGGSGADFTLDINTLDYSVNPMTLKIKTLYTVMDVA